MIITPKEALTVYSAINFSGELNHQGDLQHKYFPLAQQKDIANIAKQLDTKCVAEIVGNSVQFKEGDLELTLDERKLLKTCLERNWTAGEVANVLTLREKLEEIKP